MPAARGSWTRCRYPEVVVSGLSTPGPPRRGAPTAWHAEGRVLPSRYGWNFGTPQATVPTGETEFQFQAGNLNFHSDSYQWLVVSGSCKAQYKGTGMVNGVSGYSFLLTAYDAQAGSGGSCGGSNVDRFRIKIMLGSAVVYDNVRGTSDDIDSASPMAISGGSIVIHK